MAATWIEMQASDGLATATVLIDLDDYERLGRRRLSIGSHGYAQMWDGRVMLLHRWLMGIPVGTGYRVIVDHINHDVLDCRRQNLRIVTPSESNLNRRIAARDLPVGVYRTPGGRYEARIKRQRQTRRLGLFDTPEEAVLAVAAARAKVDRPEFLNPPAAA